MNSIQQYNGLQGIVTKEELVTLSELAKEEGQFHISRVLNSVIGNADTYEIESVTPMLGKEDMAHFDDLDEIFETDIPEGLGKPVAANDIYDYVTESIVDLLEEDIKWNQEWGQDEEGFYNAYNFESKKAYRGINQVLLGSFKRFNPKYPLLENPYYLTFKQIEKFNGTLRKGSKAKRAMYFTRLYKYDQVAPVKLSFATYKRDGFVSWLKKHKKDIPVLNGKKSLSIGELTDQSEFPILKYYNVFNGADIEGIDFKLEILEVPGRIKKINSKEPRKIKEAEAIIRHYPKPVPDFKQGGDRAFYRPSEDLVQMPKMKQFQYVQAYYSTLFHEYIHSTGAKNRLNRKGGKSFGDKEYAFEELIAEFGATFLCAEAGILHFTQRNSAAYIKGWRKSLLAIVKKDNRFIFRASSKAQAATDFILRPDENGIAKYRSHQQKAEKKLGVTTIKDKPVKLQSSNIHKNIAQKREIQTSLLGDTFGLNSPAVSTEIEIKDPVKIPEPEIQKTVKPIPQTKPVKGIRTMADLDQQVAPMETYTLDTEIGKFLGKLEKKPKGSVVVTLDAPAGSGKTRFFFQVMEDYASTRKRCLFLTLEEHSQSQLFKDKRDQYISKENHSYISIVDTEEIKTYKDVVALVNAHDIILADSFGKLRRLIKEMKLELDEHLRVAFDGKLFFLIFQRTTGKTMLGGADSEYDGDVILQVEKPTEDFRENFVTARKNRYNPAPNLKYNVYHKKLMDDGEEISSPEELSKPKPKRKLVVHSLDG